MSLLRIAILALLTIVAAAGYWWFARPPGAYVSDNGGLFPINVGGRHGFIDQTGKTVIQPQFDDVGPFSEELAPVRIGDKLGYIDAKGTIAITPQFTVVSGEALSTSGFRYGRAMVMLGGRYGFIDTNGKYIHTPEYSWANPFFGNFAPVRSDNGYAFLDRSGTIVLAGRFERLLFGFSEGLAPAFQGGKCGFINPSGDWRIDPQFENCLAFSDGLAPVWVGGRVGYIDTKGRFAVNPQFADGGEFYEGLARVFIDGKFGFIDAKGNFVVPAQYLSAGYFGNGLAPVRTDGGWGYVDRSGRVAVSPAYDQAESFQNGLARVVILSKEGYINTSGAFVLDPFPGSSIAAEKTRLADEAAKAAEAAAQANAARLAQVTSEYVGEWVGDFGGKPNSRLSILREGESLNAILLNDGWREVLSGTFDTAGKLVLTGVSVTRAGSRSAGEYSLDTIQLDLTANGLVLSGAYRDVKGNTGRLTMNKMGS